MVRDKENQIRLFNKSLKKSLNIEKTFDELNKKGELMYSIHFFKRHCNISQFLKTEKKKQIEILRKEILKRNSFNDAFYSLKEQGVLTFSKTFFQERIDTKVRFLKEGNRKEEVKKIFQYSIENNISFKKAHSILFKNGEIKYTYDCLRKQETKKDPPKQTTTNSQKKEAYKIVKRYEESYFEGRIMTLEVKEAYKILEL